MRFIGAIGVTIVSAVFFPFGSARQLGLSFGLMLLCVCFDSLIEQAGKR